MKTLIVLLLTAAMLPVFAKQTQLSAQQKIATAKSAIAHDFFDPSSAQFRNLQIFEKHKKNGEREFVVCGEVNAKNKLGAYVGFRLFWYESALKVGAANIYDPTDEQASLYFPVFFKFYCTNGTID